MGGIASIPADLAEEFTNEGVRFVCSTGRETFTWMPGHDPTDFNQSTTLAADIQRALDAVAHATFTQGFPPGSKGLLGKSK